MRRQGDARREALICLWQAIPGRSVAQRTRFGFLTTVLYQKGDNITSGEANQRFIMSLLLYPAIRQAQSNKQKALQNGGSCNAFAQFSSSLCLNWGHFVSIYPPTNISPKMGLCMFIENQTPNFMLYLVNIPCCVVQRGISFDANTLLAMYKKINVSWSPGKAVQEDCQGPGSTLPKSFRNICCHLCMILSVMAHVNSVLVYTTI